MGGKCQICGFNKFNSALELHHLNPEEKEFQISNAYNRAWDTTAKELPKCILVCANCHRGIHEGKIDVSGLKTSFNPEREREISQQISKLRTHKNYYYCNKCGKILSGKTKTGLCNDCLAKTRRTYERPSREKLKYEIRNFPLRQVAIKYGVSDIRKWCDSYNLPRKKKDIESYSDEEWEKI